MDDSNQLERYECLLLWIKRLAPFAEKGIIPQKEHFKDGMMAARILKNVIDPSYFCDLNDTTQLVKIVDKMKKYLTSQIGHSVASYMVPNCGKIILSGDIQEINRLLTFILGCAVNSNRKDTFIKAILEMEEDVQMDLMMAIQDVIQGEEALELSEADLRKSSEMATLNEVIEQLSQTNHDLKLKLSELTEEKVALLTENEKLNFQLTAHFNDPESIHMSLKNQEEYKREAERLRDDNYRLETSVDDLKLKIQVLDKQLLESQTKIALCTSLQEEITRHKDEMDSLREAAAKAKQHEISIQQYKNKLEGMEFLSRCVKDLEGKLKEEQKRNQQLEDEVAKGASIKVQSEDYKKKLIETQQALSQEAQKTRRFEFESRLARDKVQGLEAANQTLKEEKLTMTQQLEDIKLNSGPGDGTPLHGDSVDSIELLPPSVRQRITRLELENKELNRKITSGVLITSDEGSKVLVEELRKREAELDEELLTKTQELTDLKIVYEEKVRRLEAQVLAKEEELKKKEVQYNKHIEKARSVIQTLEPNTPAAANLDSSKPNPDMERLKAVREMEEKLLASAFYNYGLTLHRDTVEARNATLLQKHRSNTSSRRRSEL